MENQNISDVTIPNFNKSAIIHGIFGSLEFSLIIINIFIYVKNFFFILAVLGIISILFIVMIYTIVFKNPFYYIACLGLMIITIFPTVFGFIISIRSDYWSSELMMYFVIIGIIVEFFYVYFLIIEIRHNKYLGYFHKRYGHLWSGSSSMLYRLYYSTKEFEKLNKGRQLWQDRDPKEVEKLEETIKTLEKKFKKKLLIRTQFLAVIVYVIIFGVSFLI